MAGSHPHPKESQVKFDISSCHRCDLLFMSKEEFLGHRQLNCSRKFTCKTCGAMFTKVQSLLEHLTEVRHGETLCSVCNFATESSTDMELHIGTHALEPKRPFFCLQCDNRFAVKSGLVQHLPKHSSETPFVCQICTRG